MNRTEPLAPQSDLIQYSSTGKRSQKLPSPHRLGNLDLTPHSEATKISSQQVITEEENLKTKKKYKYLGVSIGVGVVKFIFVDQGAFLAEKIRLLPAFNYSQMMTEMCVTMRSVNTFFIGACLVIPPVEEVICRYGIQEVFLTRIPKWMVKFIAPGKETIVDSRIVKIARIGIAAALFSSMHYLNKGAIPNSYLNFQLVSSLVGGIAYGILKESNFGIFGSTLAHMTNNILAALKTYSFC